MPLSRSAQRKAEGIERYANTIHEDTTPPFRVFAKTQTVARGAVVENKRLGSGLGFAREVQASYPPKCGRGLSTPPAAPE
jgi:hypothetical protein